MARGKNTGDPTILEMALLGYQVEIGKIDNRILEIQLALKGRGVVTTAGLPAGKPMPGKRNLSEAARARIAAAQRKRWAEHRRQKALAAKV